MGFVIQTLRFFAEFFAIVAEKGNTSRSIGSRIICEVDAERGVLLLENDGGVLKFFDTLTWNLLGVQSASGVVCAFHW